MCQIAGITDIKTNHFLRVTAATRLFLAGVNEQLIMKRTGHRSVDGVRKYKQISKEQNENSSKILNQENKIKLKGQTGASKQMPLNISFTNCTGNITIDFGKQD